MLLDFPNSKLLFSDGNMGGLGCEYRLIQARTTVFTQVTWRIMLEHRVMGRARVVDYED